MRFSVFLVVLLGVAVCLVHGGCVPKDSLQAKAKELLPSGIVEPESEESGVSKFFKDLGCDIADAGRQVKEGVKTGYEYVKDKLTPKKDPMDEVEAKVKEVFDKN